MPLMPVAAATAVTGPYCLPIVTCLAFSMDDGGAFGRQYVDMFAGPAWDRTRLKVQEKADEWRRQGFVGSTMAAQAELAYTGIVDTLGALDKEFYSGRRRPPGIPVTDGAVPSPPSRKRSKGTRVDRKPRANHLLSRGPEGISWNRSSRGIPLYFRMQGLRSVCPRRHRWRLSDRNSPE